MLFIRNDKTEIMEFHGIGKQCVRSDDDLFFSVGDLPQKLVLLFFRHASDVQTCIGKPFFQSFEMLLRQKLRRYEQNALHLVRFRDLKRVFCDQRLSASDVPLYQTIHRVYRVHIGLDVTHRAKLRVSRQKRNRFQEQIPHSVRSEGISVIPFSVGFCSSNCRKIQKRLFKRKPPFRFCKRVDRRRCVNFGQRVAERIQVVTLQPFGRQNIGYVALTQDLRDRLADHGLCQALYGSVNGNDPVVRAADLRIIQNRPAFF